MIHLVWLVMTATPVAWAAPHDDDAAALRAISRRIEAEGKDADLYIARAGLFAERGLHEFALADLDHALGLGAPMRRVGIGRAKILKSLGRTAEAIDELDRVIAKEPEDASAYRHRAEAHAALGRTSEAARDYARALDAVPDPATYLALATLLANRPPAATAPTGTTTPSAAVSSAVKCLDEGIRRLGPLPSLERAALAYEEREGDHERALVRVDRMLASAPRKEALLHDRARILTALGRTRDALAAECAALEAIGRLQPRYRESASVRALTDAVRGEINRLRALEAEALRSAPARTPPIGASTTENQEGASAPEDQRGSTE